MSALEQRIDLKSFKATLLPLPKGKRYGSAVGFCGGQPIGSVEGPGYSSPPIRWVGGKPEPIGFRELKKIRANGAAGTQIAGCWSTPKGDERAVCWSLDDSGTLSGLELHPAKWEKSNAMACDGVQQVGYGYETFVRGVSRALLWNGTGEYTVLDGPDGQGGTALAVAQGVQGGHAGESQGSRACIWRGSSESCVILHPKGGFVSEVMGVGDGQQVGHVCDRKTLASRAALWSGTADSFVDLMPKGYGQGRADACARGLQAGWIAKKTEGMLYHAILWNGSATDFINLHEFLPNPWNACVARAIWVEGKHLRILGTATQVQLGGMGEFKAAEQPVLWEATLLEAAPAQPQKAAAIPSVALGANAAPADDAEQRVEKAARMFADAVVAGDFKRAHGLLAPWLQAQVSAAKLKSILVGHCIDKVKPYEFDLGGNDTTLEDLREHFAKYHKKDAAQRTLAKATEFGMHGLPSLQIDPGLTEQTYRQWMSIDFTPDPGAESYLDYCLRVWLAVAEVDGEMRIGYLEPE